VTRITGTLLEDQRTYLTISRSVLLRMRNVSDKSFRESQTSHFVLASNQPDALFHVFIYSFHLSTCFEHQVLIIRRSNCINTSSGMISLCK